MESLALNTLTAEGEAGDDCNGPSRHSSVHIMNDASLDVHNMSKPVTPTRESDKARSPPDDEDAGDIQEVASSNISHDQSNAAPGTQDRHPAETQLHQTPASPARGPRLRLNKRRQPIRSRPPGNLSQIPCKRCGLTDLTRLTCVSWKPIGWTQTHHTCAACRVRRKGFRSATAAYKYIEDTYGDEFAARFHFKDSEWQELREHLRNNIPHAESEHELSAEASSPETSNFTSNNPSTTAEVNADQATVTQTREGAHNSDCVPPFDNGVSNETLQDWSRIAARITMSLKQDQHILEDPDWQGLWNSFKEPVKRALEDQSKRRESVQRLTKDIQEIEAEKEKIEALRAALARHEKETKEKYAKAQKRYRE